MLLGFEWEANNGIKDALKLGVDATFDPNNPETSPNARHTRGEELMRNYKGRIDVNAAKKFEGDRYDAYLKKDGPDARRLRGHVDASSSASSSSGVRIWEFRTILGEPCSVRLRIA